MLERHLEDRGEQKLLSIMDEVVKQKPVAEQKEEWVEISGYQVLFVRNDNSSVSVSLFVTLTSARSAERPTRKECEDWVASEIKSL